MGTSCELLGVSKNQIRKKVGIAGDPIRSGILAA
jgi:hypothetical protein